MPSSIKDKWSFCHSACVAVFPDGFFGFGRSNDSISIREREGSSERLGFPAGIVVILIESTSNGKGEMWGKAEVGREGECDGSGQGFLFARKCGTRN